MKRVIAIRSSFVSHLQVKKEAIIRLLASVDILLHSNAFVGIIP